MNNIYILSGHPSGLSIIRPSATYFNTSSFDSPWYGCAARVAISQSTTPYDLKIVHTLSFNVTLILKKSTRFHATHAGDLTTCCRFTGKSKAKGKEHCLQQTRTPAQRGGTWTGDRVWNCSMGKNTVYLVQNC